MFYAAFVDPYGKLHSNLYFDLELYRADTFSPDTEFLSAIDFKISGKSYVDRKEAARNIANNFQDAEKPGLSYRELAMIGDYFAQIARRFGLVQEFRENGII